MFAPHVTVSARVRWGLLRGIGIATLRRRKEGLITTPTVTLITYCRNWLKIVSRPLFAVKTFCIPTGLSAEARVTRKTASASIARTSVKRRTLVHQRVLSYCLHPLDYHMCCDTLEKFRKLQLNAKPHDIVEFNGMTVALETM